MAEDTAQDLPAFNGRRLLYVVTGGLQAIYAPMWLSWLRSSFPELSVHCAVTRTALTFTTTTSLSVAGGQGDLTVDVWPERPTEALHVRLADWPDAVLVHPASMGFIARLSLGFADSPVLLALQCTSAPIVVCPGLPPGGHVNAAYRRHVAALAERPNVVVLPPVEGVSMSTGKIGVGTAVAMPVAIAALEDLRRWVAVDE